MTMNHVADKEIREEYVVLMEQAIKLTNGKRGWEGALDVLKKGTDYSKTIVAEMTKRKIRGIGHEDGRFDYLCSQNEYCRCSQ